MREAAIRLFSHVRGVWRYRWLALGAAWVVAVAGWVWVHHMPDEFLSTARVYVDTRSVLRPLLRGLAIEQDVAHQVQLMTRVLLSRPNLEKVARMTDLDLKVDGTAGMDQLIDEMSEDIGISTAGRGQDNLFHISANHSDPQIAKRIVQSLLTIFVESTLGETRKDSDSAQKFLDEQIADYERRLNESEQKLKEFKARNYALMPEQGGDHYQRLQGLAAQVEDAELQLREATNRRNELRQQVQDAEENLGGVDFSGPVTGTDARIDTLRREMDALLVKYTDQHPAVRSIQKSIEDLEAEKAKEQADRQAAGIDINAGGSPVAQQMRLALADADALVASLGARVQEYKRRVDALKEQLGASLEVEQQFKALNRDYEVTKQNHDQLLARRETARLSEEAQQSAENVKFRVVDPPYVPTEAASPNRPLLVALVLAGSLLGGAAIALLMTLVRPTFDDRRMLREITGLPVLGALSMIWTPERQRRHRMGLAAFSVSGIALLGAFLAVLAVEYLDIDIAGQVTQLKDRLL